MAGTGTINISGVITGQPGSTSRTIGPFVITLPAAKSVILEPALAIGANGPYPVPSGATYVQITFPSSALGVVTLKGSNAGDTGLPINNVNPSLIGLDPTASAINLNCTIAIPQGVEIAFY